MDTLKVVTWNMNHWQRTDVDRSRAWSFLTDELSPDVALLQECVPPEGQLPHCVFRVGGISQSRPWGSAVTSRFPLAAVTRAKSVYSSAESELLRTHPGAVAVADVEVPDGPAWTFVSLYGLIEES